MSYAVMRGDFDLTHQISDAVEAAYRRGDMIEKRRTMMGEWADFLREEKLAFAKIIFHCTKLHIIDVIRD